MRAVVDTGVLVSALILPRGAVGDLLRALRDGRFVPVYSTEMLLEVVDVLQRPKIRLKYHLEPGDAAALIALLRLRGELVISPPVVSLCRDPKDDKFLAAALAGQVECIVTGDKDLLALHPFRGISILPPAEFLLLLA